MSNQSIKYTPLEEQFLAIKSKHPDAVLLVQCGYKYKLFDEDARIASRVLQIGCFPDHNFVTASIPLPRLHVHLTRLVRSGLKVGVVKQVETTALKALSDNKSGPFTRTLSGLYTRTTLIGPDVSDLPSDYSSTNLSVDDNSLDLLCVHVSAKAAHCTSRQAAITVGLMAVQPSTGTIVYEEFRDSVPALNELHSRLVRIRPAEVLYPDDSPEYFQRAVEDWKENRDNIRVEQIPTEWFEFDKAFTAVTRFYAEGHDTVECDEEQAALTAQGLTLVADLPQSVVCCFNALVEYLKPFHMLRMFYNISNFQPFQSDSDYLKMNSTTLENLEIFTNNVDHTEKASLFQLINHTTTSFGRRELKQWLAFPLKDVQQITRRQAAVKEFLTNYSDIPTAAIKDMMRCLPDLEKMLCSAFHRKISPWEFCCLVKSLSRVCNVLSAYVDITLQLFKSDIVQKLFTQVPLLLESVPSFLEEVSEAAARSRDYARVFTHPEQFPDLTTHMKAISDLEKTLNSYKDGFSALVGEPSLEYASVCGFEYLVEVKNDKLDAVPFDWIKVNSTKQATRFHPPLVRETLRLLSQHREQLQLCFRVSWDAFLNKLNTNYQKYKKTIKLLAVLDCVMALAEVARIPGYTCPQVVPEQVIDICSGQHPVIDCIQQYVPNDTELNASGVRVMIITGPNMGGKSCYIKQVALICILALIGSFVPAERATIGLLDGIYTRMGASDSILERRSTFKKELEETADIVSSASSSSLVILDELGRGTSTHDGAAIAYATLLHFIEEIKCFTLFVTHYPLVTSVAEKCPEAVINCHMSYIEDTESNGDDNYGRIVFLYQLEKAEASGSYGINVAALAGLSEDILTLAQRKSFLAKTNSGIIQKDFVNFFK